LELRDVRYTGVPGKLTGVSEPVSLSLHAGEILGMAGLVGAGRTELAEALFGLRRILAGMVLLRGKPVHFHHPWQAVAAAVLLVPEDRRYHGLILTDAVERNISLPNLDLLSFLHVVARREEKARAESLRNQLRIRTPSMCQPVGLLSGGNQQKVVLGKWLVRHPSVLIVDEPTRGVDVGAKSEIYELLDQLAGQGVAILMISSDLEEILGMSDRVAVLHQGRLAGILSRDHLSEEAVMQLATGGTPRP
jgi:ribose transport system ATP-binding protein